jgi:hypothetical protein
MSLTRDEVEAVRELYEKTTIPVPEIRRRSGLTEANFRKLRETEGWKVRRRVAEPGAGQGRKSIAARLASRIEKAALTQLAALDARLAEGATPGTQEITTMRELMRLAREADALVNATTKAAMRSSGRGSGSRGSGKGGGGVGREKSDTQESEGAYVEWMRAELTRRLDCLAAESGLAGDRRET